MNATRLKPTICPECFYRFDHASGAFDDSVPKPGDVTLCLKCGHALVFDQQLGVREPNEQERTEIANDVRIQKARRALQTIRHERS